MAVTLATTIYNYMGASTDTKPASCPIGSTFYETDTHKQYVTPDGGTTWVETQDLDALVLGAGAAIIGKVGIDQTTPGTTNRVDVGAALPAGTNALGKVGHDVTGIAHGRKAVAAAGTDEALAASTPAKYVIITANAKNTGTICVGGSGVDAAEDTRTGIPLSAGGSCGVPCDNLADIYIDATVSGEGVSFAYLT